MDAFMIFLDSSWLFLDFLRCVERLNSGLMRRTRRPCAERGGSIGEEGEKDRIHDPSRTPDSTVDGWFLSRSQSAPSPSPLRSRHSTNRVSYRTQGSETQKIEASHILSPLLGAGMGIHGVRWSSDLPCWSHQTEVPPDAPSNLAVTTAPVNHSTHDDPEASTPAGMLPPKKSLGKRIEAYLSRLSTKNNFWHRVCSLIWLPFAFRSGISLRRIDAKSFTAVLPYRRFNRNWYNAMAGAALLGNSEVAAGMYLFAECGSDYEVICKRMEYRFMRPCYGPAVYRVANAEDVQEKIKAGGEFNIALDLEISQQMSRMGKDRDLKVGRCSITFHCTPKDLAEELRQKRRGRLERSTLRRPPLPPRSDLRPSAASPRRWDGGLIARAVGRGASACSCRSSCLGDSDGRDSGPSRSRT
jgi:hypothetical protein